MRTLILLAGLACTSPVEPDRPDPDTDTSDPEPPDLDLPLIPGAHEVTLRSGGRDRRAIVVLPANITEGAARDVLMVLHGGGGRPEQMRNVGFEPLAERTGAILVYPSGFTDRWNDGRSNSTPAREGIDDVRFLRELAAGLDRRVPTARLGVVGASNGGMMSYHMGCEAADELHFIGAVIASMPEELAPTCAPVRPIAVRAIQGTDDPFVTFEGGDVAHDRYPNLGEGGPILSAEATRAAWAGWLGCDPTPTDQRLDPPVPDDPTRVTRRQHTSCDFGFYIVEGMGHAWPPFPAALPAVSGPTSRNLNATAVLWEAFAASATDPR